MQMDFSPLIQAIVTELHEQFRQDEVLDTRGAAALLLVSPNTAMRWATKGVIPGKKLDGVWRFRRSAILEHLSKLDPVEDEA